MTNLVGIDINKCFYCGETDFLREKYNISFVDNSHKVYCSRCSFGLVYDEMKNTVEVQNIYLNTYTTFYIEFEEEFSELEKFLESL